MAQAQVYIALDARGSGKVVINGLDVSEWFQRVQIDAGARHMPEVTLTLKRDTLLVLTLDKAEIVQE